MRHAAGSRSGFRVQVSELQNEIKINKQRIFYDVSESELESVYVSLTEIKHPEEKPKTYIITFSLDFPQDRFNKDCGKELWYRIKNQFILFKNKYSEQLKKKFVIRISYKYSGARFECEFDDLLDTEMETLHYVNTFAEMFPNTKEIRIVRNGPIIIRLGSDSQNNSHGNKIRKFINDFRRSV